MKTIAEMNQKKAAEPVRQGYLINEGTEIFRWKWDGREYMLPPGEKFLVEEWMAKHVLGDWEVMNGSDPVRQQEEHARVQARWANVSEKGKPGQPGHRVVTTWDEAFQAIRYESFGEVARTAETAEKTRSKTKKQAELEEAFPELTEELGD